MTAAPPKPTLNPKPAQSRPWRRLGLACLCLVLLLFAVLRLAHLVVLAGDPQPPRGAVAAADRRLAGLPLIEAPVAGSGDRFVVFFTGDNGWQKADRGITAELNARGFPVVVVDSLRYFSGARGKARTRADLAAIIERYSRAWNRPRVIVAGYSFGADASSLVVRDLAAAARARIAGVALVAPGPMAELTLHDWSLFDIDSPGAHPLTRVVDALAPLTVVCLFAERDGVNACADLRAPGVIREGVPSNHRLKGQFGLIAQDVASVR